jgi:glycolate dehydrogenase iron-sulfur subunit
MQTQLPTTVLASATGRRADEILRSCVHCGFCNATCPTYLLTGDERDGPRGRIYLIKDLLETERSGRVARTHLDRCLTCRACETTCPSGVAYGELAEIARDRLEAAAPRNLVARMIRAWLVAVLPHPRRFRVWARLGSWFRALLPRTLSEAVPTPQPHRDWVESSAARRVVLLEGCVQSVATPAVNEALARVLAQLGVATVRAANEGCCGSFALHLGAAEHARRHVEANARALFASAQGAEAILSTASGCGVTVKDYGRLAGDGDAAEQGRWVAAKALDASEYLLRFDALPKSRSPRRVAVHSPCTLQHGQRQRGNLEQLLERAGHTLVSARDGHLCCGSAGTYSVLQPKLANALRENKIDALTEGRPDVIATANVGCALHLGAASPVPVKHWIELLA